MALIDLNDPKMEFFIFGLQQKLDRHSCAEFNSDSDGNGFKAQKLIIDLLVVLTCINQINYKLQLHPSNFKRARICKPAMAFVTDRYIDL